MRTTTRWFMLTSLTVCSVLPASANAQELPAPYAAVLATLHRTGDLKDDVLKVNIPRNDLKVTVLGRQLPTPFGFGGWVALTKASDGMDVLMGDLVLTEDEVNPVMSAILDNGLEVTALHNHFFWEQPRIFYMHVHGMGRPDDLARRLVPAITLIDQAIARVPPAVPASAPTLALDGAVLASIVGTPGDVNGAVYKITIGRPDIDLRDHGARMNARMGLNTWAAFTGTPTDAVVAGDIAMLEPEVTPVLTTLRAHGIGVVAIHHHMTGVAPMVIFLHYYASGPAEQLARGVRAAIDQLGRKP